MNLFYKLCSNRIAILPILILALTLRAVCLDADPPFFVETHYMDDEGGWAHNARNHYLTGEWITNTHNAPYYTAPGYSHLLSAAFQLNGLSLCSARLLSVVAGTLTVFTVWLLLSGSAGVLVANLAALFMGLTGFHVIYSRLAMAEALLTAMLVLALYLWSFKKNRLCAYLSGALFASMIVAKISAVYFIPVLLLLVAFEIVRKEADFKQWAVFGMGSVSALVLFEILKILPDMKDLALFYREMSASYPGGLSPKYVSELFIFSENIEFRHGFFNKMLLSVPVLFLLTVLYLVLFLVDMGKNGAQAIRGRDHAEMVGLSILLGNLIVIGLSSYKPERRYLPLLPGICILAAYTVQRGFGAFDIRNCFPLRYRIADLALSLSLTLPVYVFFCWTLFSFWGPWNTADIGAQKGISFNGQVILLLPLYAACLYLYQKYRDRFDPAKRIACTIALVMAHIVSAWLYFGLVYLDIPIRPVGINIVTIVTWIVTYLGWRVTGAVRLQTLFRASPALFLMIQGVLVVFALSDATYTYQSFGEQVRRAAGKAPIVTDISAPILDHAGEIFYGFPKDRAELEGYGRYWVLNTKKKGNMLPDTGILNILGEYQRLPDTAALKEVFHVFPYGRPEQSNLIMYLWEVDTRKTGQRPKTEKE